MPVAPEGFAAGLKVAAMNWAQAMRSRTVRQDLAAAPWAPWGPWKNALRSWGVAREEELHVSDGGMCCEGKRWGNGGCGEGRRAGGSVRVSENFEDRYL